MRLEEAGLVEVFPQSRTIVSLIHVPLARQEQYLRRSIEQEALRIMAYTADAGWVDRLHDVIEEQGKWAKAGDLERFNRSCAITFAFAGVQRRASRPVSRLLQGMILVPAPGWTDGFGPGE
jgi:hypothetical protein